MPEGALDGRVRHLREQLLACDAAVPQSLWRQFMARRKDVCALMDDVLESPTQGCDHVLAENDMPTVLASLVVRLVCPPAPCTATLTVGQLEALRPLLRGLSCTAARANVPAERFLATVAAKHPSGALIAVMALLTDIATSAPMALKSLGGSNAVCRAELSRQLAMYATMVALVLPSAATASPRIAAALCHDPRGAELLTRACDTTIVLLRLPAAVVRDASSCVLVLARFLCPPSRPHPCGGLRSADQDSIAAALLTAPQVPSVLLAAVCCWRWAADDVGLSTKAANAITAWLDAQQVKRPLAGGRPWSASEVTAELLITAVPPIADMRNAGRTAGEAGRAHAAACELLFTLLSCQMRPDVRHRAFPAVVAYAEQVVDEALDGATAAAAAAATAVATTSTAAAAAAAAHSGGAGLCNSDRRSSNQHGDHSRAPAHCAWAPLLMNVCSGHAELQLLTQGDSPAPLAELRPLQARARWVVQHRLVEKCEALLRFENCSTADGGCCGNSKGSRSGSCTNRWPMPILSMAVASASRLATRTHMLLMGDERDGAAAHVAHESLLATVRKLMQDWPPVPTSSAASSTGHDAEPCNSLAWLRAVHLTMVSLDHAGTALRLPTAAAAAAVRGAAMQLLPSALQRACALLSPGSCDTLEELDHIFNLVYRLPHLHSLDGLADVTFACGAPALLSRALQTVMDVGPLLHCMRSIVSAMVLATLHSVKSHPAWLREAHRLTLVEPALACFFSDEGTEQLVPHTTLRGLVPAAGGPLGKSADVEAALRATAVEVDACIEASMLTEPRPAAALCWDGCLLELLAPPWGTATAVAPGTNTPAVLFFGCCSRRCTNLSGFTEASLHLRKYCSVACQRRAWRTGHRRACQAWQRDHRKGRSSVGVSV